MSRSQRLANVDLRRVAVRFASPTHTHPGHLARALALAALAALVIAPLITPGAAQAQAANVGSCPSDPDQIVRYADGWEEIEAPEFWVTTSSRPRGRVAAGAQEIRAYAAHPYDPEKLFVTNGSEVMRSTDGGCSFATVFDLASDGGPVGALSTIVSIEIPASPSASERVYLLVAGPLSAGAQVFVSPDSGTSWAAASTGLAGAPLELVIADTSPQTLYLLASLSSAASIVSDGGTRSLVYRSRDGGSSWELASEPGTALGEISKQRPGVALVDVALDPLDDQILWGASGSGLYRSRDGGATWELVAEVALPVGVVEVIHGRGQQAQIFAFASESPSMFRSADGGRTWDEGNRPGPEDVESSAHSAATGDLVVSLDTSEGQVYQLDPRGVWELLSWRLHPGFRDLSVDRAIETTLYAYHRFALWRLRKDPLIQALSPPGQVPPSAPSPYRGARDCASSTPLPSGFSAPDQVASLEPNGKQVVMTVGESRKVPYTLDISAAPLPLDVYYLVDTSGSMEDAICGLGMGLGEIVADLSEEIPDLYFGVAEYNHYYGVPKGQDGDSYQADDVIDDPTRDSSCYASYRRQREIGPPDPSLVSALARIHRTCGGSEPTTFALVQSVLGTGGGEGPLVVAPGLDAQFREDAVKVIVNITDERVQTWDGTTIDEAIQVLGSKGVHQVALNDHPYAAGDAYYRQVREDLESIAAGTNTFAPAGGVDCNQDGTIDIQEGDPLVCDLDAQVGEYERQVGSGLEELLKAITDERPVELDATEGNEVIEAIAPAVYPAVDMLDPHVLPFTVTYHCDAVGTFPVTLDAHSRTLPLARADATVVCVAPATIPPPPTAALALPPGSPQLARIPQPNPNPNPNPNPQPRLETQAQQQLQQQAQAQAQGVAVPQRQQQQQMAFVTAAQQVKEQAGEHAMVARSSRRDPLGATKAGFIAGALSLTLAYGITTLSLQRRVRVARRRWQ